MGVNLPTSAVGNGRVLATLGAAGEIMTFFYPHVDFAQNVRQLLPALYLGDPGHGRFLWTFEDEFEKTQEYLGQARVLVTTLRLESAQLELSFTDFCPPDETALVRRVRIRTTGDQHFSGRLMKYFELRINEITGKQSVSYGVGAGIIAQYCRDIAIAVGGERPSVWRCGKSIAEDHRSAKSDMYDGHLSGQPEDIGQVDFALGWSIQLEPGEEKQFDIILAAAPTREQATEEARRLNSVGGESLQSETVRADAEWLGSLVRPKVDDWLVQTYDRSLLSIRMLQDAQTFSIVAAPEFDPSYELCGGYGYCWPRDATEAVQALAMAGESAGMRRLCDWYLTAQLPSGQWGQRYWSNGKMASSWSLREDFLQVDQTAAAIIALCEDTLVRPAEGGIKIIEDRWPKIRRAAEALAAMVDDGGWHAFACDLWETFCGTFVYTNAAIHAALTAGARVADAVDDAACAARWREDCARMKQAVVELHNGHYFPRGVLADGDPDPVVDSSTLGVSEPFGVLSPGVPEERRLIEANLSFIEERLRHRMDDGTVGIRRYEGDGYLGGVIGCVNTLWFALVNLQVANSYLGEDDNRSRALTDKAVEYIGFCLKHATPTGLLPELIGIYPEYPYWAAPHGWASGLMVKCVLELDRLRGAGGV